MLEILSVLAGFLGTALTSFLDIRSKKQEQEYKLKRLELERTLMLEEAKQGVVQAEAFSDIKVQEAEAAAFVETLKAQQPVFSKEWLTQLLMRSDWFCLITVPVGIFILMVFGLVEGLNKIMRSALTLYSLGIASWVTYQSWCIMQKVVIDVPSAVAQWQDACDTIMFLAVTLVTWWFGDRRVAKHLMHQKQGK